MENNSHIDRMKENQYKDKKPIFRGDVSYDINSLPAGKSLADIMDTYAKSGILLYDSSKGIAPYSVKSSKSE